jgi:uncharacterized protein (TIGR02118 family)
LGIVSVSSDRGQVLVLKFVVVLKRKSDWTPEKFRDYFVRVHGPLAEQIPGLRRYKQNFPAADAKRKPPAWDCVVELYFDNKEAMEAAWMTPEGEAATRDLEVFADLAQTTWSIVEERTVVA